MKKMDFDAIAASSPLNVTAGAVVSSGTHYEPQIELGCHLHSDMPIPTRAAPPGSFVHSRDLTGDKFGRFTVIGLAAEYNPKKNAPWVVRCACGAYETRKARAITNPLNTGDCCRACQHLELIKRRYKRDGSAPLETFLKRGAEE